MLSMGASYAHLQVQQDHYKERIKRKEEKKRGAEKKGSPAASKARVHPAGESEAPASSAGGAR